MDQNYSKEYFDRLLQIWDQERMPEEWEIGIICPIFKKGDHRECSSYRGVEYHIQNFYMSNIQQVKKIFRDCPR